MPARLAAFSCFPRRPHDYDMPREAIEEFKELYRRRYGIELTDVRHTPLDPKIAQNGKIYFLALEMRS